MTAPSNRPPPARRAALVALALLLLSSCRCGEPAPERAWEVGTPLTEIPGAAPGTLADYVPAGAPFVLSSERPLAIAKAMRADRRFAQLLDPQVLADLALSDTGAAARAVRQRLNDLSRLPIPEAGLDALLDGPLILAARTGPSGIDFLFAKRLSRSAEASWRAAQMLESVSPSLHEVRVERYRGCPLRKVLVGENRRISYFLLRDLLVAGTSDNWVKESLDLALGGNAPRASQQPAVQAALREEKDAALVAVVDVEAMRSEPGRPGLGTLAFAQSRWLRVSFRPGKGLKLELAPESAPPARAGRPAVARFAPRRTLAAVSRGLDLAKALEALLPVTIPSGPHSVGATELRDRLRRDLVPALGGEAFWLVESLEPEDDGALVRHLAGFAVKDAPGAARALEGIVPLLLSAPIEAERDGAREVVCGADALCLCLAGDVLLVSNRATTIKAALAAAAGQTPALELPARAGDTATLLFFDGARLASALERAASPEEKEPGPGSTEPVLAALRALGTFVAPLHPTSGLLAGEVASP